MFFRDNFVDSADCVQKLIIVRLAFGEKRSNSRKKVGQGAGWQPGVWKLKWGRIWIPRGMQLEVNLDCGCERWTSLMSMSGSSLSVHHPSGPEVAERRAPREAASQL